jgi:hypothetical protein
MSKEGLVLMVYLVLSHCEYRTLRENLVSSKIGLTS